MVGGRPWNPPLELVGLNGFFVALFLIAGAFLAGGSFFGFLPALIFIPGPVIAFVSCLRFRESGLDAGTRKATVILGSIMTAALLVSAGYAFIDAARQHGREARTFDFLFDSDHAAFPAAHRLHQGVARAGL